jgi:hypothetical protein
MKERTEGWNKRKKEQRKRIKGWSVGKYERTNDRRNE